VCLHGFMDTWRTWELVLPALERHHDVFALTLAGHAGGPAVGETVDGVVLVDAAERAMDEAGIDTAHIVGNSLGGYVAMALAARGRATTVVAFAPAGGWIADDHAFDDVLEMQRGMRAVLSTAAPFADAILATRDGRRRATQLTTVRYDHIPAELLAHQLRGAAMCSAAESLVEHALHHGWSLDAQGITCPVRIVWGAEDRLLSWPRAAVRYRDEWAPNADWVVLDGVGHCPQLDVPLEAAELILGFTSPSRRVDLGTARPA
jgi:pimeloyl-ACP methyl ester carboxylesterase